MEKRIKILMSTFFVLVLALGLTSAMVVKSVDANNFQPGNTQDISVKIKNTLGSDAKDISLILDTTGIPFSIIDSDDSINIIYSDDTESFNFVVKASSDAKAGSYQIPYTLSYSLNNTPQTPKKGTFSLTIEANPELVYSASTDTPVVGSHGKISLNIVNQGLGDAKFLSVTIIPEGYTLLSGSKVYLGTISSDDSQSESFNVVFDKQDPILTAQVTYKNFDNQLVNKIVNLPLTVYSKEEALKLGLVKPDNSLFYVLSIGLIFGAWMITKKIRKKKRLNKAQGK